MNVLSRFSLMALAAVVLFTSTCFAADVHYCKDEVQTFAFFEKAAPCANMKAAEEKKLSKCCMARQKRLEKELSGKTVFKKKKCCHNDQVGFKADQSSDSTSAFFVSVSPANVCCDAQPEIISTYVDQDRYNPSLKAPPTLRLRGDFQAFYQVFRI